MKICIYTDNHFCASSPMLKYEGKKYTERLDNQIETINWVEQLAVDKGCSEVVHLGDFFDKSTLLAMEVTALRDIKWNNLKHTFIVGNHEIADNTLKYNSLNVLASIGRIIDSPTIDCGFGYEILYLPYTLESNRKPLEEIIEETTKKYYTGMVTTQEVKERIILSHNDIKGIQYGQFVSKHGFSVSEIEKCCSLFVNGHLHNQMKVSNKIINLGNITGLNFNEDATKYKHTAMILDTSTMTYELVENPYALCFYKINSFKALQDTIASGLNNYAVATIKVPQSALNDAKTLCLNAFRNYKIICTYNDSEISDKNNKKAPVSQLISADHIKQFKEQCGEKFGNSEILMKELSLL